MVYIELSLHSIERFFDSCLQWSSFVQQENSE